MECEDRNQTIDNFPKTKTMRFYFLFGIACLSLLWEVSSQWSPRASDSEFYRALGPVSSFLAFLWVRNGLWPEPKTRNWVCNRWLRPRQRTARTYQRLQTISSSIFSGQRPEKILSRALARDKGRGNPQKTTSGLGLQADTKDKPRFGFKSLVFRGPEVVFWDPKRTRAQARGRRKPLCRAFTRARFLLLLFGWFGHTLALESQSMLGSSDQTPGPR